MTIRSHDQPAQLRLSDEDRELIAELIEELRICNRREAREARRRDEYRAVFLNSKFPFGKPIDRWGRGRG